MARPIRIEFENAVYHVMARGNHRKAIFRDDRDRDRFLETLGECVGRFGPVIHAYCLMPHHYHLLVQTPRANLSAAMGWLQTTYSIRFNRRHARSGQLFQGRFKSILVDKDLYAATLIKYIHANSVRPQGKQKPIPVERKRDLDRFRWSSHKAFAGLGSQTWPDWLCLEWLCFFGRTKRAAQAEYRRQLAQLFGQPVSSPWDELRGGLVLGNDALWDRVQAMISGSERDEEIHWTRRSVTAELEKSLAELVSKQSDRRVKIWILVRLGGHRMTEVAKDYGFRDGSGVHQVVKRLEARADADPKLARTLALLRDRVSTVNY